MSDGTDCQTALEKTMHREKVLIIVVPEEATEFALSLIHIWFIFALSLNVRLIAWTRTPETGKGM